LLDGVEGARNRGCAHIQEVRVRYDLWELERVSGCSGGIGGGQSLAGQYRGGVGVGPVRRLFADRCLIVLRGCCVVSGFVTMGDKPYPVVLTVWTCGELWDVVLAKDFEPAFPF
jgi:hypothetical protein